MAESSGTQSIFEALYEWIDVITHDPSIAIPDVAEAAQENANALLNSVQEQYEALRYALEESEKWLVVPSDIPGIHHEALGRARDLIRRTLKASVASQKAKP